jgi:D-amino-acid oxidase
LVFEKNANFFAENCRKSLEIVIITSVPGHRAANISLQLLKVIHNYGHGGSGVTLFWGCAEEVVQLIRKNL